MKFRKSFMAFGFCVGIAGALCSFARATEPRPVEAAVLVNDPENIAEAIKTAVNTLNILSEEQKQVALQILNMKKLDADNIARLVQVLQANSKKSESILGGDSVYALGGILSAKKSVPATWDEILGTVQDVFGGTKDIGGCFGTGKPGLILIDRTNKDAILAAKTAQEQDAAAGKLVLTAIDQSNNAEGNLQALQAGNAILAAQAQSLEHGNRILASMASVMAVNAQRENLERARQIQEGNNSAVYFQSFSATLPTYGD